MFNTRVLFILITGLLFLFINDVLSQEPATTDSACIIRKIEFTGNRQTRGNIIKRELTLKAGDTLDRTLLASLVEESRENLINTSLFNFVYVDTSFVQGQYTLVDILFTFVERWYLWPFPVVKLADRNFNTWLQAGSLERITYGFYLQKDNFRGKKEKLIASYITGYEKAFGFTYEIPYLTKQQHLGLIIKTLYKKSHSVPYDSYNNKLKEIKNNDFFLSTSLISSINLSFRKGINYYHYLSFTHNRFDFSDTLINLNPDFSFHLDHHPEFFSISYRFKADFRDYQPYPLKGSYLDMEFTKHGLDLMGNTHPNQTVIKASYKKYWNLLHRWYYAASVTAKISLLEDQPFFMMKGLGYENDFARGYEYYVIDGDDYVLIRNDVKWNLLKTRVGQIRILPESIGKYHYTVFITGYTDLAYMKSGRYDNLNFLANRWLLGTGLGINVVTYYDKVLRFEISHNHKGETGLYMHFVAPI